MNAAPAPVMASDTSNDENSVAFTFVQALAAELSGGKVELPGFPHIVMRVQKVLADESADASRIVRRGYQSTVILASDVFTSEYHADRLL